MKNIIIPEISDPSALPTAEIPCPQDTATTATHILPLPSPIAVPAEAHGLALKIIASIAFIFALQWAQKFFIPLLFGILIAYTLNPLVAWLERIKIPRKIGVSLILASVLCGAAVLTNTLHSEFQSILEELPVATRKISHALGKVQGGQPSAIQTMQTAATAIEQATTPQLVGSLRAAKKLITPEQPTIKVKELVLAGSMSIIGFIGQATMVLFLVFFFLLSGDTFKRKLVKLTGPSLSRKKITIHILDDINTSIQNYMSMLLVTNVLLALLMWVALRSVHLQNAGAWAVAAGFLHVIPYFGPMLITASTGVAAFMQFETLSGAFMVSGISIAIATLIGTFITTWMTGKIAKMNAVSVFISLLFWGWLWGIWGLLLGIPIIVIIKVISEHVDGMHAIAELLSE